MSSVKGSSYERLIAVRLSLWISGQTNPHLLWRTPNSGARATAMSRRKKNRVARKALAHHAGDLEATHEDGERLLSWAYLELKHLADAQMNKLIFAVARGSFTDIWLKASEEAAEVEKEPIVILKETRHGEVVVVTRRIAQVFMGCGAKRSCVFPRLKAHVFPLRDILMLPFVRVEAALGRD